MKLGPLLRRCRLGHSQYKTMKALSDAVGISLEHLRRIETGQSFPSGKLLKNLVEKLELPDKDRKRVWLYLAKRQLDPVTLSHVFVSAEALDRKTARIAIEVLSDYYDLTPADEAVYMEEITARLKE